MSEQRNVYLSFIFIAFGGLLFGYIIGVNSNIVTKGQLLCDDSFTGSAGTLFSTGYGQCYTLDPIQQGLVSSLNLIGACLSSLFCFRYADRMGRKLEVQIGALLYGSGALLAAFAPNLILVYLGLALYGLGVGFAMHAAPVYIAEISPAEIRGMLVSAKEAVVVLGIFLGFFVGFLFSSITTSGWRWMIGVSGLFAVIMEIGIAFVPQSPRFLVLKAVRNGGLLGRDDKDLDEARSALQFFRGTRPAALVNAELEGMCTDAAASVGANGGQQSARCVDAFRFPLPLVIGCGLVFLQQVTGQPSVLYFATNIFKAAGFGSSASLSSVLVGLVKLIATLFTVWRVDNYGRRFLLFVGIIMMAAALALLTVAFMFRECTVPGVSLADCADDDVSLPKAWAWSTVVALMLYVSGYQVGFGPIAWLMISEIFPLSVRGAALSLAAIVNFGSNIGMTLTQKVLLNALTPSGVFGMYLVLSVASLFFVYTIVPETKGKTLEQIESELAGSRRMQARDLAVGA